MRSWPQTGDRTRSRPAGAVQAKWPALVERRAALLLCLEARPGHGRDFPRRHELKPRGAGEGARLQHSHPPEGHRQAVGIEVDPGVAVAAAPSVDRSACSGVGSAGITRGVLRAVYRAYCVCGRLLSAIRLKSSAVGFLYVEDACCISRVPEPIGSRGGPSPFSGHYLLPERDNAVPG